MPPKTPKRKSEVDNGQKVKQQKKSEEEEVIDLVSDDNVESSDDSSEVQIISDTNRQRIIEPIRTQEGVVQGYNVTGPNYSGQVLRTPNSFMERITYENANFQNDLNNTTSKYDQFQKISQRIENINEVISNDLKPFFNEFRTDYQNVINSSNNSNSSLRQQQDVEFNQLQLQMLDNTEEQAKKDLMTLLEHLENLKTTLYKDREVVSQLRVKNMKFGSKRVNVNDFLFKYVKLGNTREKGLKKLIKLKKFFK
jgi:hypothetical protein